MKRPHKPYVPGRGDARTTWSAEVPDGPSDGTLPDLDGSRLPTSDSFDLRSTPLAKPLITAKSLPLTPPLPGSASDAPELTVEAAATRANELLDALAVGDSETVEHLRRTAATVEAAARALGWDDARIRWTTFGALLHDIGKIGVEPQVMQKPGPLSVTEQAAMRAHVDYGSHLVTAYGFPPLVSRIVQEHHERLDGSGYPMGLRGSEICEEAQLVMLADIADAMLSRRAYKLALTMDDVCRALDAGAGQMFDPAFIGPVIAVLSQERPAPRGPCR